MLVLHTFPAGRDKCKRSTSIYKQPKKVPDYKFAD